MSAIAYPAEKSGRTSVQTGGDMELDKTGSRKVSGKDTEFSKDPEGDKEDSSTNSNRFVDLKSFRSQSNHSTAEEKGLSREAKRKELLEFLAEKRKMTLDTLKDGQKVKSGRHEVVHLYKSDVERGSLQLTSLQSTKKSKDLTCSDFYSQNLVDASQNPSNKRVGFLHLSTKIVPGIGRSEEKTSQIRQPNHRYSVRDSTRERIFQRRAAGIDNQVGVLNKSSDLNLSIGPSSKSLTIKKQQFKSFLKNSNGNSLLENQRNSVIQKEKEKVERQNVVRVPTLRISLNEKTSCKPLALSGRESRLKSRTETQEIQSERASQHQTVMKSLAKLKLNLEAAKNKLLSKR